MTPGARAAAAIAVMEKVLGGAPAEVALTNWGRSNRYAGSGDRAAIRDIVYDILRCRRSLAALGGGADSDGALNGGAVNGGAAARRLVLGWARERGWRVCLTGRAMRPRRRPPKRPVAYRRGWRRWIVPTGWRLRCGRVWVIVLRR